METKQKLAKIAFVPLTGKWGVKALAECPAKNAFFFTAP